MDVWEADKSLYDTVKELIANHHTDLVDVEDEIAIIFREKASKTGDGRVHLGKSRKAPPLLGVLTTTDYKFVIELAGDEWNSLNNKERLALLDHHLCACRVEKDQTTGEIKKCWIQPPVGFYREEVERHGWWRTGHVTPPDQTTIDVIFGDD